MFHFALRKMRGKRWMVLCLLVGNILLAGIACSNPMYTRAVLQRMLTRNLETSMLEKNRYPGTATITATLSRAPGGAGGADFLAAERIAYGLPQRFSLPLVEQVTHYSVENVVMEAVNRREDEPKERRLALSYLSGLSDHCKIVSGQMYEPNPADGVLQALVSQKALVTQKLLVGQELVLRDVLDEKGQPQRLRIVGVFEVDREDAPYWVRTPSAYSGELMLPEETFRAHFVNLEQPAFTLKGTWHILMDYTAMRGDKAQPLLEDTLQLQAQFKKASSQTMTNTYTEVLTAYVLSAKKVTATLLVLQAPIFVLLAAFIFMVSRQLMDMEQGEIALYKSRGAGKGQILRLYLYQSLALAAAGLAAGVPLGAFLCQVLGSANAFLEFVQREALPVEFTPQVLLYAGLAALLSVLTMTLPALRYADVSIVAHKQRKNPRRKERPFWQKIYLDLILLAISLYGLYTFNGQKELLAQRVAEGAALDPLLFFSCSLFILGAGLLALRVIPLITLCVFTLGKKGWSPALYAAFLRVLRGGGSQGFIMVFLILTIALGMFNLKAARTINVNEEERIRYENGADLVVQEVWSDNSQQVSDDPTGTMELMYEEPDFAKYEALDGVQSLTRVQVEDDVAVSAQEGNIQPVRLMGIHTKEFGQTAWFKDNLLPAHWYNYLNAISQDARAVLVSKNFADLYGYQVGDVLSYRKAGGDSTRGVIYGFVEYWPSYNAVKRVKGADGLTRENDSFLIVAHLSQLQAAWGVLPYQVWIKTEGSPSFIYDFAQREGMEFRVFRDTAAQLVTLKRDPVFQGTNGILTVGFIVVLLLCATGFLIYWVLSIQSRALQFGIFRAMGMTMGEILTMLCGEQALISGLSIAAGAAVGELASRLFVPLIQIAYASSDQAVPLQVAAAGGDMARLLAVVLVMMAACMAALGVLISKIRISQALKLGED